MRSALLLLLGTLVALTNGQATECGTLPGWKLYNDVTGFEGRDVCLVLITQAQSWAQGEADCRTKQNSHLLGINSVLPKATNPLYNFMLNYIVRTYWMTISLRV